MNRACALATGTATSAVTDDAQQVWAATRGPTRRHDRFPRAMRCALASLVVVVCCAATAGAARRDAALSYTAAAQRDLVDSLPGWGPVDSFNLFSG